MFEREGQRLEGVIEAQQVDRAGDVAGRPQRGERIGRRPEADIPQDEVALVTPEALGQAQLADIQRLGLGDRADHWMKRLVMGQGMDAVRPIGELDYSVSGGGLHGGNLEHAPAGAKLKLGGRASSRAKPSLGICKSQGSRGRSPSQARVLAAQASRYSPSRFSRAETCSTSRNTRSKLRPASFLISSRV